MNNTTRIKKILKESAIKSSDMKFFKTDAGHYAQHDRFIGVNVPTLRKIAKQFSTLSLEEVQNLLASKFNEERLLALLILESQFRKAAEIQRTQLYQFYLQNLQYVNNWNLVDASAHLILGAHLANANKDILLTLAKSDNMWERRVAMVSTWYFIRRHELQWTFKIATILLQDPEDLIQKAVGWMLREAGKKDEQQLIGFLDRHAKKMPRTMLRYAIEKFDEPRRKLYLVG